MCSFRVETHISRVVLRARTSNLKDNMFIFRQKKITRSGPAERNPYRVNLATNTVVRY